LSSAQMRKCTHPAWTTSAPIGSRRAQLRVGPFKTVALSAQLSCIIRALEASISPFAAARAVRSESGSTRPDDSNAREALAKHFGIGT
jgi:hypothetical protein